MPCINDLRMPETSATTKTKTPATDVEAGVGVAGRKLYSFI
jgi:hypothetical protein